MEEVATAVGTDLGQSRWLVVDQNQIDRFADVTGDHQWIHVDRERAAAGPFGTTVAHGYLTLCLGTMLAREVYRVEGVRMSLNYGTNKVRFTAPLPVDSRIRTRVSLVDLVQRGAGSQLVSRLTVEAEHAVKPVCVAEVASLLVSWEPGRP